MSQPEPNELTRRIAEVFETTPELLPHMLEILQDFPTLGGPLHDVVRLLREGGLPRGASVLDLGCGRGEIALAVAREFNAQVTGVDAFSDALQIAHATAREEGRADSVLFVEGDLRSWRPDRQYDAALLISVGPIFGEEYDYTETMAFLRECVRPGGQIVIEDCYLKPGVPAGAHPPYRPLAETEAALTTHGDKIEARLDDTAEMQRFNEIGMELVTRRAREVEARHPELAEALAAYLERQQLETDRLVSHFVGALWRLRRQVLLLDNSISGRRTQAASPAMRTS